VDLIVRQVQAPQRGETNKNNGVKNLETVEDNLKKNKKLKTTSKKEEEKIEDDLHFFVDKLL
jgi:hypothetical protein